MQEQTIAARHPAALLEWAGHRTGGVRRLFYDDSGRPSGGVIRTALLSRLEVWAAAIGACVPQTPRVLLLVGGPGNGKTEAVEFTIRQIDQACGLDGRLVMAFSSQFLSNDGKPPPRVATVETRGLCSGHYADRLAIVQDASAADSSQPNETAASLLIRDLNEFALSSGEGVYLACVNRGVLDDALIRATDIGQREVRKLLERVVQSVGMGAEIPPCWPLDEYPNVAVWPMDVESLVGDPDNRQSPVSQLMEIATDPTAWPESGSCAGGALCPFCFNRNQLSAEKHQSAFLQILRWYELATGKRWSFRDLFSLVSYVFAGVPPDGICEGPYHPCLWAGQQASLAGSGSLRSDALLAPYMLVASQYQHALFGDWSSADTRRIRRSLKALGLEAEPTLKGLHLFLSRTRPSSMPSTLAQQLSALCELLDPALVDPDASVRLSSNTTINFRDLDIRFSQSVSEGFSFIRKYRCMSKMEVNLLSALEQADTLLLKEEITRKDASAARYLRVVVRDFSCRLVRRSVGTRAGITRDAEILADYEKVIDGDPLLINNAVKQIATLLNKKGSFDVSLNTTFGEPEPSRDRLAWLSTDKQRVRVAPAPLGSRPALPVRFLIVGSGTRPQTIPLTYELFHSVRELMQGLVPASLPRSVIALLDTTRARMGGHIVRDEDALNGAEISLGNRPEVVAREVGEFLVKRKV